MASSTGAGLVALDGTALTVVRPAFQHDLHASVAAVQWAATGYLVTVAALPVFAGRLGDHYGHRLALALGVAGVAGFAASSAGIGLASAIGCGSPPPARDAVGARAERVGAAVAAGGPGHPSGRAPGPS
ncbi:MFS transporter [Kitasatospora sp. NPDC086791]|uniref:MFS transporter n=1 Tax=Kitasatospora sp. NPDC086791 TaxID=3155178 RepID=UPI0034311E12